MPPGFVGPVFMPIASFPRLALQAIWAYVETEEKTSYCSGGTFCPYKFRFLYKRHRPDAWWGFGSDEMAEAWGGTNTHDRARIADYYWPSDLNRGMVSQGYGLAGWFFQEGEITIEIYAPSKEDGEPLTDRVYWPVHFDRYGRVQGCGPEVCDKEPYDIHPGLPHRDADYTLNWKKCRSCTFYYNMSQGINTGTGDAVLRTPSRTIGH